MSGRSKFEWLSALAVALAVAGSNGVFGAEAAPETNAPAGIRAPRLFPDYSGITVPPNIAPLNFRVEEPGERFRAELRSVTGNRISLSSRKPVFRLPAAAWQALLKENAGNPLYVEIAVQNRQGDWRRFPTITNFIAREPIDPYIAYRLLKPLYNTYINLGIYQRHIETFEERPILENRKFDHKCLNCHTFLNRRPETFVLHTRGFQAKAQPMVLVRSNEVARVDRTMGYLSWHPSGRLLAFSANKLSMFSHTVGETRDVYDASSDIGIYRVDSNTVVYPSALSLTNRNETWPSWAPDGRHLFFCSASPLPVQNYRQIKYDLMRVSYDIENDKWGAVEMILAAQDSRLSAAEPRVSPDARWLLFCLSPWGNFPIYNPESDLYLMDLKSRAYRRLEINSEEADSWHCWSSNGRWVVFSSKRLDGLFARPHFTYVDAEGHFHKPFLLPQEDPAFYDSYLKTFNAPEFVLGPVGVTQDQLAEAIRKPKIVLLPKANIPAPVQESGSGEGQSAYRRQ